MTHVKLVGPTSNSNNTTTTTDIVLTFGVKSSVCVFVREMHEM